MLEFSRKNSDTYPTLFYANFSKIFFKPGKRYFSGGKTKIFGEGVINIDGGIDVGITGLHKIFAGDTTVIECDGEMHATGHASIGKGCRIFVDKNAKFTIGINSYITGRANITVTKGLSIGNNCAIAWGITIIDNDYHLLTSGERNKNISAAPIYIGDNVWIGCNVTILKGVKIPNGTVIAAASVLTKSIEEENVLVAGNPAKIIRRDVSWIR